jgi:hypothetical protein
MSADRPVAGFRLTDGRQITLDPVEVLRTFIADEDQAVVAGEQGLIMLYNGHLIEPLLPKARRWLNPAERRRLYTHTLRLMCPVPVLPATEDDLLRSGYDELLPLLDTGFPTIPTPVTELMLLLLFGYDSQGPLAGAFVEDHIAYRRWRKVWMQCNAYWDLPGMLNKVDRFRPHAEDPEVVARALATLAHRRYEEGIGSGINLPFWGLMLIVLLAGGAARDQLLDDTARLSSRDTSLQEIPGASFEEIRSRYIAATQP